MQPDPLGFVDGPSVYGYAGQRPLSGVDPTGEFFVVPMLLGAGLGALTDVGFQLIANGVNSGCIDWGQVGVSAGLGAFGGGLGSFTRLARANAEFSHWIPGRYIRPMSLSGENINPSYIRALNIPIIRNFINSSLNGNYVSPLMHALTDPFRNLKGMKAADTLSPAFRHILRTQEWLGGSAAGSAVGIANSAVNRN